MMIADPMRCCICRFSNAVAKTFVTPSPRFDEDGFIDALIDIIDEEQIDWLIPTFEEILFISQNSIRLPDRCQVLSPPFSQLIQLHNKWLFYRKLETLDLPRPQTQLINSPQDLETLDFASAYALKACYSRASQEVYKVPTGGPYPEFSIEPDNPWVAQEWLEGKQYCSYSICHGGKVYAHLVYPVEFAIDGNSCITFEAIEHAEIRRWVEDFVDHEQLTGQFAFDFIQTPNGTIYAIECNPRSTSGLLLFHGNEMLDQALFNNLSTCIAPPPETSRQISIGMLLYGWRRNRGGKRLGAFLKKLISTPDVVYDRHDLMPCLFLPFVLIRLWVAALRHKIPLPSAYTFDLEWNGREGAACDLDVPLEEDELEEALE